MARLENSAYSNDHFADVRHGQMAWYSRYVNIAYEKTGICNGIGGGNFGVRKRNHTSGYMSVMRIQQSFEIKSDEGFMNPLHTEFADDNDISDYAKPAVSSLSSMGVINGVGDNMFAPKDNATRAQAAVIIYAAYKRMNGVISSVKKIISIMLSVLFIISSVNIVFAENETLLERKKYRKR